MVFLSGIRLWYARVEIGADVDGGGKSRGKSFAESNLLAIRLGDQAAS